MKTFLALFLVAALIQVSTATNPPNQRRSSRPPKPQPPPQEEDVSGTTDDETPAGSSSEVNSDDDDQQNGSEQYPETDDYVQPPSPKVKKAAAAPPARARKPNDSQKSGSKRVSSSNKQQTDKPKKAASKTAAADKTDSPTESNQSTLQPGLDMKSLDLGSLISSIAKMPSDLAKKSQKYLKDLATTLPADSPVAALLNGLRFMFTNQSMMKMLDNTFSPFNQAMSRLTGSTPGMLMDNPLSNAAGQIFAVAMKKSGSVIKAVSEVADAAFENAKDAAEDFEAATQGLAQIPIVGDAVSFGHGLLKGGLDLSHNLIATPTDIAGSQLEDTGSRMHSRLERSRLRRQRVRPRVMGFISSDTAGDSDGSSD